MKWLKRGCWLAVWCVWLWLGFGLYRELPRDLGPVVCKLPLNPTEQFEGFLRGMPSVVTKDFDSSIAKYVFRRRSATTGEVELESPMDQPDSGYWTFTVSAWHGYVIGYDQTMVIGASDPGEIARVRKNLSGEVQIFNLRNGERRALADLGTLTATHIEKPWALFCRNIGGENERATILDLETGRRMLEQNIPSGGFANGWLPYFLGTEHFAVPIPDGNGGFALEVRSISSGTKVASFELTGDYVTASHNGKIAWYDHYYGVPIDLVVHDLSTGKLLRRDNASPHLDERSRMYPPRFSADGRSIFSPGTGAIVDLETRRRRWEAAPNEMATLSVQPNDFEVAETWKIGSGDWSKSLNTFTLRSRSDGSFISRTWVSTAHPTNEDHTLLLRDGAIHRLPPRVNWLLLAVCQAILALPLMLLWAVLRVRLRRAARRQPAVAANAGKFSKSTTV